MSVKERFLSVWNGPGWVRAVIALVVLVVVVGAVRLVGLVLEDREGDAQEACEGYVRDSLKSPSSAEFSEAEATERGEYGFTVSGSVDSENGFGAMIRNRYECRVNSIGDDWLLIDLDFEDQG
ncbi:hypothetical protein [Nocardioides sp. PD653]|uniref:hypothetical protein n=1 Tax=Nocardioides sp. PD653 TaxID=393303 RepID=UPI0009F00E6F|nr:hypothetical protein [Nocardioides sp. PD653]GAW57330.1 uncharacterized protein PD653_4774 [Nocardioides sp. PD653]